ncbi:hypothetical protein DERP_014043 [Dermatophagoides pteronyssinus]|uniref:Uncharacterized protein n=1 Tax=Dermatophagoides pteronyssinus TaxID=6956 RepID=A0ABQ8JCV1_DERPT|nr:hypothetical protein DERP_014043 [Dermatophagoides pteronyssinus]
MIMIIIIGQSNVSYSQQQQKCQIINGVKKCKRDDGDYNEISTQYPDYVWENKQNQTSFTFVIWISFVVMLSIFMFFSVYLLYVPKKDLFAPDQQQQQRRNRLLRINSAKMATNGQMNSFGYSKKLQMFNPNIVRTSIRYSGGLRGLNEQYGGGSTPAITNSTTTTTSTESLKSIDDLTMSMKRQQQQQPQNQDTGPIRSPPDLGHDHQKFYNSLGGGFIVRNVHNNQQQSIQ